MNYYKILRFNSIIKSERIKILGVGALFVLRKRYLNVFLDPILNCNFKCLMCYFSDPDYKPAKKRLSDYEIQLIAKNIFPFALKLQIGCGAEPSLYNKNEEIIRLAKSHQVPHISFTTNANILTQERIESLVVAGLDEIIISMHGTQKDVYEKMMPGADYKKLHKVLAHINLIKQRFPSFKLRINYTVNPDNINDLAHFGDYLDKYKIDVLQVRPIRKLGNTEYSDFDLKKQEDKYSAVVANLTEKCKQQGVVSLINSKLPEQKLFRFTLDVANYTYCYVAPEHIGNKDYNPETENYPKFLRRYGFLKNILKDVFLRRNLKFEDNIAFASYDVNL